MYEHELLRLAWAQLWQVTTVVLAVALLVRLIARRNSHLAHVLWMVVLLKCITPPLLSSPSGVFCWIQSPEAQNDRDFTTLDTSDIVETNEGGWIDVSATVHPLPINDDKSAAVNFPSFVAAKESRAQGTGSVPVAHVPLVKEKESSHLKIGSWLLGLCFCWLAGTFALVCFATIRWMHFLRSIRCDGWSRDEAIESAVSRLAKQLRLRRRVRLVITHGRTGPAVIGIFRPTLLLPKVIVDGKSPGELEPILAHELIHLRRGDLWIGLLQVLAQALWWFHPLVWLVNRLLTREAERCCDEEVVAELGCDPARYARCLIDVLELKQTLKPVPVFPGVRPVEVTSKRLERIMKLGQGSLKRTPWWCWLSMILIAAMTLPGASYVVSGKEKSKRNRDSRVLPSPVSDHSRMHRQTYRVADLLEQIKFTLKISDDQAREFLIERIKNISGVQWDDAERLGVDFDFGDDGKEIKANYFLLNDRGTPALLRWSGSKLIAVQSKSGHFGLKSAIAQIRKNGLEQIAIELHTVAAPPELINSLGSNWITPQSDGSFGGEIAASLSPRLNRPLPGDNSEPRSTARVSVEKNLPVMVEVIDSDRRKEILDELHQHAKASIVSAPRVTLFNGQSAVVQDTTQRPFVVGMFKGKPQRRVVSSGWKMHLRPMLRGKNLVWLDYEMTLSDIRSVDETKIKINDSEKAITLQVPEVAKTQIDSSFELPLGKTLLVGGLKTTDVQNEARSLLVLLRATKVDTNVAAKPKRTAGLMFGVGVNSKAGVKGQLIFESPERPSDHSTDVKGSEGVRLRVGVPMGGFIGELNKSDSETRSRLDTRLKQIGARIEILQPASVRETEEQFELKVDKCWAVLIGADHSTRARLQADSGLLRISKRDEGDVYFELVGNAMVEVGEKTKMRADRIVADDSGSISLLGNACVVNDEQGFELSADKITCDDETVLEGNARLNRKLPGGRVDLVAAKRIVWVAESGQIRVDGVKAIEYPVRHASANRETNWSDNTLERLVRQFNSSFEEMRFAEANAIARDAMKRFPDSPVAKVMVRKATAAQHLKQKSTSGSAPFVLEDGVQFFPAASDLKPTQDNKVLRDLEKPNQALVGDSIDCDSRLEPSDIEVLRALEVKNGSKPGSLVSLYRKHRDEFRITKTKVYDQLTPERVVPLVGPARTHLIRFRCSIAFKDLSGSVEIDRSHLHHSSRWQEVSERKVNATDVESRIKKKLESPIELKVHDVPLRKVLALIAGMIGENVVLDTQGLAAEGVTSDALVSINLDRPVQVVNALSLILDPLQLKFKIENEVIKVTSQSAKEMVYVVSYHVADLVIPIPKVVRIGDKTEERKKAAAQFDSLIELIQSTIAPDTWDEVGGPGSIQAFKANLSLVIGQTKEVHQQIVELLDQLRRLQDLQVTCQLRTFCIPQEAFEKTWGKSWDRDSAVLTGTETLFLLQSLKDAHDVKLLGAPKVTLFNGQRLETPLDYSLTGNPELTTRFHLTPVVSNDRRFVRLQLTSPTNAKGSNKKPTDFTVKDGHTLVLDVTKSGLGEESRKNSSEKLIITVTPNIIIQEEDEDVLNLEIPRK